MKIFYPGVSEVAEVKQPRNLFHPVVVVGLGYDFLFKSLLAHGDKSKKSEIFGPNVTDKYALVVTKNLGFFWPKYDKKTLQTFFPQLDLVSQKTFA